MTSRSVRFRFCALTGALALGVGGCFSADETQEAAGPMEVSLPCRLAELFPRAQEGQEEHIRVRLLGSENEPIPHALLWITPEFGGRMALQLDATAELGLWFDPEALDLGRSIVEARRFPEGHVFPDGPIDEVAQLLDESKLMVVLQP